MSVFIALINKNQKKVNKLKGEIRDNLKSKTENGRKKEFKNKVRRNVKIKNLEAGIMRMNVAQRKIEKKTITDAEASKLIKDIRNIIKDFL